MAHAACLFNRCRLNQYLRPRNFVDGAERFELLERLGQQLVRSVRYLTGEQDVAASLARERPETDVIAPMYPEVADLVDYATRFTPTRPLIMCEYIHAMGNSCGGLADYWHAIRTHRGLQGGFVWDWVDQALVQQLPDGTERLAYGGDGVLRSLVRVVLIPWESLKSRVFYVRSSDQ